MTNSECQTTNTKDRGAMMGAMMDIDMIVGKSRLNEGCNKAEIDKD